MRRLFPGVFLLLVTTGVAVPALAGPREVGLRAAMDDFEPHRASYELSLERARSGDVSAASGRLSFEWADACDGWSVRQITRVKVTRGEGPNLDFGWRFDSWEAKDGTAYRFFIDRFDHGSKTEEIAGRARLTAVGEAGTARFDEPVEREVALPAGTIFPTWHAFELIAMGGDQTRQFWRTVFDGSAEDDGLSGVSAILVKGGERKPPAPKAGAELLSGVAAHRIYLAYYSLDPSRPEPVHEQEVLIYGNGVADDFVFDYGDFALRARLVELKALPEPAC